MVPGWELNSQPSPLLHSKSLEVTVLFLSQVSSLGGFPGLISLASLPVPLPEGFLLLVGFLPTAGGLFLPPLLRRGREVKFTQPGHAVASVLER